MLITMFRDATQGVMPPLGGGLWRCNNHPFSLGWGYGACSLSSFLLFKTKYVRYLMTFWYMFFMRVLMLESDIFRLASLFMECSCITPLTPTVMNMRGLIFHPLFCMVLISMVACIRKKQLHMHQHDSTIHVQSSPLCARPLCSTPPRCPLHAHTPAAFAIPIDSC